MSSFILYSTEGCHLCDLALDVIARSSASVSFIVKDIADDETLLEKYGTKIPVLSALNAANELYWPFDEQAYTEWCQSLESQ